MFTTKRRDNDETFVTLAEDAPEWLKEAVYQAHNGDAPNDWVYFMCESVYAAGVMELDNVAEWADSQVDIYTKDLYQWAADSCLSDTYAAAKDTAEDCGSLSGEIESQLRAIQYFALEHIGRTIVQARIDQQESEAE